MDTRSSLRSLRWAAALALTLSACGDTNEPPDDPAHETSGLALTFDTLADTDVAGFLFTATEVDCATGAPIAPPNVVTATEDLEDMYIPGTGGMFEDAPFDGDSNHLFSDHFFALSPGCYDVVVQPITEDGTASEDCASASQQNVEVIDGETTEILLISQCVGDPSVGGLDVIAVLNHPPVITGAHYDPSKFICEEETTICVSVADPDADPVVIVPSGDGWTLVSQTDETADGVTTSCFTFAFEGPGDYTVNFTAYDMGYDADGVLVTMEEILLAQGTDLPSQDTLSVPVHVLPEEECIVACDCPEGFEITPAGDECVRTVTTEAIANGPLHRVCGADPSSAYGWAGAQFPDGLVDNGFAFYTSRLNTIGVWACQTGTATTQDEPLNEWIGFSVCLDIEEPGDYVVGMAADNRLRFRLNGVPTFTLNTGLTENFNYWWMNPVSLGSGLNIIELEGRNDGSIASFGAEIYGPYAASSLTTDAAMAALNYPDNIVWSTAEIIGQPFLTGQASGFSCPDGFALNACTDEITCTQIERRPCE